MTTKRLFATAVIGALGIATLVADPAAAGPPAPRLKIATNKNGPFVIGVIQRSIPLGEKQVFHLKAKSLGGAQDATLEESAELGSDYDVKYVRNGNDITNDVQIGGYEFRIKPKAKRFKVRVATVAGPPAPDCLAVDLIGEGDFNSDTVGVEVNGADCSF